VFRLVLELACDGIDVAVACRVLQVSRSGYYEWRNRPPSDRDVDDAHLANQVVDIHAESRGCYGAPRVHAELRLGRQVHIGRKRVARLLRITDRTGIGGQAKKRRHRPAPAPHDDLVGRRFIAAAPNRLWCTDVTEHPTAAGKVYCCAVLDVYSRVVVGWSIADHMRTELVVDALQMATWRRRPQSGTIVHSDRGSQGGFNWSSQHLEMEVLDGSPSAGSRSCAAAKVEVSGSVGLSAACRGCVLAPHRGGEADRGCGRGGRRVGSHRCQMVPSRWRHAANESCRAVGPVSVVLGA